ncbi:acylphosphatase [Ruficoccus amylovorans]|uniref:acylphosphatase n=1 Tax=Ruficoccus amylovorans TaxID=1804625 RepID=A0A842HK92_9BACT|nr:acylphosphatase [Ruficoccus amylovorans]MBC2596368.1 acylphosphatase [Ruficoccus amylovorans]
MSQTVFAADVHFSGHVQGVGFRYTTLQVAKEFAVVGEVKNLSDGRVYLRAEGERAEVEAFVEEVGRALRSYIRETEVKTETCNSRYRGFTISR